VPLETDRFCALFSSLPGTSSCNLNSFDSDTISAAVLVSSLFFQRYRHIIAITTGAREKDWLVLWRFLLYAHARSHASLMIVMLLQRTSRVDSNDDKMIVAAACCRRACIACSLPAFPASSSSKANNTFRITGRQREVASKINTPRYFLVSLSLAGPLLSCVFFFS
jgi:hypothetical protein